MPRSAFPREGAAFGADTPDPFDLPMGRMPFSEDSDTIRVEALPLAYCLDSQGPVEFLSKPDQEFAGILLSGGGGWKRVAILLVNLDPFVHCPAKWGDAHQMNGISLYRTLSV